MTLITKIKYIFIAVTLTVCGFFAYSWGIANLYFYKADYYLVSWYNEGKVETEADWNDALEAINKAIEHHPNHPHYHNIAAKILEWGATSNFSGRKVLLNQSLENMKNSLALRPGWSDSWISIAMIKWRLGEIDDEFWQAIELAIKHGPYMPEINIGTSTIYFAFWSQLNLETRKIAIDQIERTMLQNNNKDYDANYRHDLFNVAKRYQHTRTLCLIIDAKESLQRYKNMGLVKANCAKYFREKDA